MTAHTTAPGPPADREAYPRFPECLPETAVSSGPYQLRFARSPEDLDAVFRLRFEVFNVEMGEGLEGSFATGRDEDEYDLNCHHLVVTHQPTDTVIGTYRMQTRDMAAAGPGFYSATEFVLEMLGDEFLDQAVELGRACIARDHRNGRVLFLLWKGLADYMFGNRKRYFFGCCSLTSQDAAEGRRVMRHLEQKGLVHPTLRARPQPACACYAEGFEAPDRGPVKLPKLMRLYLQYGARISGPPAIDRQFKTIDYLAVFDVETIDERIRRMFVSGT